MAKENSSEIVFVVDRSGSMSSIASDMRGGFDTFIKDQKKVPGNCLVTLTQFDDKYEVVYEGKPLETVPALELEPRGSTALLDAIGRTIDATGARLTKMNEADRPSRILFVITTDGHENASKEYNRARINQMIDHQRSKYAWDFVFLGANQDAIRTAEGIGIMGANAMNFASSPKGANDLMKGLSNQVVSYRSAKGAKGREAALADLQNAYNSEGNDAQLQALRDKAAKADES